MFTGIPNILTLFRIIMIPVFISVFYVSWKYAHLVAGIIFAVACATDWLDGYLARRLNQTTRLGAFLDPVADKLIVSTALICVVSVPYLHYLTLAAVIIIGREIVISALREWMAQVGQHASVSVVTIAKWKTFIQMVAITCLVVYTPRSPAFIVIVGYATLYVATLFTLWTMLLYLYASRKAFADNP